MNEIQIAENLVIPYLIQTFGWPKELISPYGRVPIQMGSTVKWGDIVCYISDHIEKRPWVLIEVKTSSQDLHTAVGQAESYALQIHAPFFGVTDGNNYEWYQTGPSQGKHVHLIGKPPIPIGQYLKTDHPPFSATVNYLVELFLNALAQDKSFLDNTKEHDHQTKELSVTVFDCLDTLTPDQLKDSLKTNLDTFPANRPLINKAIDDDFQKIKKILYYIKNIKSNTLSEIQPLLSPAMKIKGGNIFFISQLLAAAHIDKFMVIDQHIAHALKELGLTDIVLNHDSAESYVLMNDICVKLYSAKIRDRVTDYKFGIAAAHNFLWHWINYYKVNGLWMK
ncbi:type I restriction enzyme HsdR N-terminal domain-containing protein [Brevibacillus centrosporus]|uniref:type I restriction enzyme HsdR N-terminal domain-containing protein n=1 Tax=Brevibacillus centrosporus TaxID=54910 RepID=UPI001477178A|nr:type I restriction enzyme HsdR N-terminal domain-containing protein [Brevibacillus centrosporus]MEC2129328.1 type I restriction enzyme HsdR N-terminal domain-containing protein [Brevibacillus centrosporus]